MSRLLNYFLRGLVVVGPLALTVYVCVVTFRTIDSCLGLPIRGAGFLLALVLITLVGFLASSIITRSIIGAQSLIDAALEGGGSDNVTVVVARGNAE